MEVKAKLRNLRISPKKTRLVVNIIRGMEVKKALAQLKFIRKRASRPVEKLVRSAMANAANNFDKDPENLYIKEIRVDQGPTLKRWRPRAFGRAGMIRKKSSHISLILEEKETVSQKKEALKDKDKKTEVKKDKAKEEKKEIKDEKGGKENKKQSNKKN